MLAMLMLKEKNSFKNGAGNKAFSPSIEILFVPKFPYIDFVIHSGTRRAGVWDLHRKRYSVDQAAC